MMFLIIDTETNGKPLNYRARVEDLDNWPRIVQLAWLLFDDSESEVVSECRVIKPEGWTIPDDATAIHGITNETALKTGEPISTALAKLRLDLALAKIVVAHNLDFDLPVCGAEFLRSDKENPLARLQGVCTMKNGTDLCQIPGNYGFKWPRLGELHKHLFGSVPETLHDALADARSCAKCFFEMRRREERTANTKTPEAIPTPLATE